MYVDDLVLICKTKEKARWRYVAQKNVLESKGLKVIQNISTMKVMKCVECCTTVDSSGSMQYVWKEGGCVTQSTA